MHAFFKGAVLAVSSALILACGGGGGPFEKANDHADKIASIIEANKTDGDKAADAVDKYIADNKADLDAVKAGIQKEMGEMMGEFLKAGEDKDAQAAVTKKFASKLEDVEKRGKALKARMEKLEAENPAIKDNARLKAATSEIFGAMEM